MVLCLPGKHPFTRGCFITIACLFGEVFLVVTPSFPQSKRRRVFLFCPRLEGPFFFTSSGRHVLFLLRPPIFFLRLISSGAFRILTDFSPSRLTLTKDSPLPPPFLTQRTLSQGDVASSQICRPLFPLFPPLPPSSHKECKPPPAGNGANTTSTVCALRLADFFPP